MQNPWRIGPAPRSRVKSQHVQHRKFEQDELRSSFHQSTTQEQDTEPALPLPQHRHDPDQETGCSTQQVSVNFLRGLPAPGILPFPVAPARLTDSYLDVEFYFRELVPQQHAIYEVFDVHDIYDEFLQQPIAAVVFATWQCNIAFMRSKLAPTSTYRHQYYKRYGQVLSTMKEQLLETDTPWFPSEDFLLSMLLLIKVSYTAETSDVGDLHLMKLYNMLSASGACRVYELSRFTKSALRQLALNCDIVRGHTLDSVPFPLYSSDEGLPEDLENSSLISVASLPKGFGDLVRAGRLGPTTIRILVRLTGFVPGQPHANRATFQAFEDACPCLKEQQMTFEKLLCLTVMVYCNLAFSQSSIELQPTLSFGARRSLLNKAILTFNTYSLVEEICMLWMFTICVQSCMNKSGTLSSEGHILLSEIHHRYAELTWSRVESTLIMFRWDSKFNKYLQPLFENDCSMGIFS